MLLAIALCTARHPASRKLYHHALQVHPCSMMGVMRSGQTQP